MVQTPTATTARQSSQSAGEWVLERPPEGPARGKYSWPAWGVITLGAALVLVGIGYMLLRIRRRSIR